MASISICSTYYLRYRPELLEFGGSENPRKERQLEAELRREQQEWIASTQKSASPTLNTSATLLRQAGIPDRNIALEFSYPTDPAMLPAPFWSKHEPINATPNCAVMFQDFCVVRDHLRWRTL